MGMSLDRRKLIAVAILLGVILFFGGAKYYEMRLDTIRVETQPSIEQETEKTEGTEGTEGTEIANGEEPPELLTVHVVGAVEKPGVYILEEDKRINDAVQLAIPTDKADLTQINLAAFLEDGKQIYVPAKGEKRDSFVASYRLGEQNNSNTLINLNTAMSSELDSLPGIGPALAERIIAYREKNGPFGSIEDITKVSGIGPSLLEKIRNKVTVR